MHYFSTKIFELGSCAFRQPYANSHCKFLHGYRLTAKFVFACSNLDQNNWVVDFGGLKDLKNIFEQQFDHTTIVWSKDPQIELFKTLNERGVIDLRVMESGVGIEKFAEYCFNTADKYIKNSTNSRCWLESVEVWEHDKNSAFVKNGVPALTIINESSMSDIKNSAHPLNNINETTTNQIDIPVEKPVEEAPKTRRYEPIPAPVGNVVDKQNNLSFKAALDNLSWGNPRK